MKREIRHIPVMLENGSGTDQPRPGMTVVDCTLGLAGHSRELLSRVTPGGRLIAIDFDERNIELARDARHHGRRVPPAPGQLRRPAADPRPAGPHHGGRRPGGPRAWPARNSTTPPAASRYKFQGPLDMRMDPARGRPAAVLVNTLSERELRKALLEYGDETDAPQIAKLIVERRKRAPIETTRQLMEIVCEARDFTVERARGDKLHPATRTFQALRILTNREMGNLENLLRVLPGMPQARRHRLHHQLPLRRRPAREGCVQNRPAGRHLRRHLR